MLAKKVITLSSLIIISALLLTACNGTFSLQGSSDGGGINIPGLQPGGSEQSGEGQGIDQTTLILIIAGFAILILILLAKRK